jgi:hypothetical protein
MVNTRDVFSSYGREYLRVLDEEPMTSPEYFRAAFTIAASRLRTSQLANEFEVTESTIYRYIRGKSAPVEGIRKVVLERVVNMLADER